MPFLETLKEKAKQLGKKIVLPEGSDERMVKAAVKITEMKLAEITILGNESSLKEQIQNLNGDLNKIKIIDPLTSAQTEEFGKEFAEMRRNKGKEISDEKGIETMKNPLYFGAWMLKKDIVDGFVAGAENSTGNVLRAAIQSVGTQKGVKTVSGGFIMQIPEFQGEKNKIFVFADSAVVPDPTPEQLADIAAASAKTYRKLVGGEPKVALLSFSTKGSASHPAADKVIEAVEILKKRDTDFLFDGELQLDAAIVKSVAEKKAKDSKVAGNANVLVFPDLSSGNIGYKLVQRLANAEAIGPIIQGMAKPANDLSRGCSVDDIINVCAITALYS